ncbi:MAG: sigma-70 family RNA polymerase sigma factor, partial [Desulforhabdus sp.]|nr:sigma-70 family RNA polymerase sigma factor [Desulforhabdus sp.]
VNTCKNRLASAALRHRSKTVAIDPPSAHHQHDGSVQIADPAPSPLLCLEKKERDRLLQNAISALPHAARTVVVLRDIEGLSYEEIAGITDWNPGTVKSKLARARKLLKDNLKGVI